jgi:hypothetical protein
MMEEVDASKSISFDSLSEVIRLHRQQLETMLSASLQTIALCCVDAWEDQELLDVVLIKYLSGMSCCRLLYAIDSKGIQRSSNVSHSGIDKGARGQDLGGRPYLYGFSGGKIFLLSDVYISRVGRNSCITALHRIDTVPGDVLGYIAADYYLRDFPQLQGVASAPAQWRQIKGDPSIRQTLFHQERIGSAMDARINQVHDITCELVSERGVFHAKLHYGSSRATLWLNNDPHRYRIHVLDEIIDPSVCLAYPKTDYPEDAVVTRQQLRVTLDRFVNLRLGDNTVYLRSASINVINGMVGLNFSCDGSHYIPVQEFLEKDHQFWFGAL